MGNCALSSEDAERLRRSEEIDQKNADDYMEEMEKIKLLLLGAFLGIPGLCIKSG